MSQSKLIMYNHGAKQEAEATRCLSKTAQAAHPNPAAKWGHL